jgi:hypothetical protein
MSSLLASWKLVGVALIVTGSLVVSPLRQIPRGRSGVTFEP